MKTRPTSRRGGLAAAFTLPDLMVAMSIFALVLGAVMAAHMYGLKMFEITRAKLGATDDSRKALSQLLNEVQACRNVDVGAGDASSLVETTNNAAQRGNALQLYNSTNTANWVRYYLDAQQLKRITSSNATPSIVASYITNAVVFTVEDFGGNTLTNNQNSEVIGLTLQFYQLQYPSVPVKPGSLCDFYQLRTRITRRTLP